MHRGLRTARRLLLDVMELGLPVGCEWLDPVTPQYIADAVAWGAIGARTTESQVHRQLASGLSMPVGFKNGTDGDAQVAIDACRAAAAQHTFFGVDAGRGGGRGDDGRQRRMPHYPARRPFRADALPGRGRVRCPRRGDQGRAAPAADGGQPASRMATARRTTAARPWWRIRWRDQIASGEQGIVGVMLESFLAEGKQALGDPAALVYGQSITDAARMDIGTTADVLGRLAEAVRRRRDVHPAGVRRPCATASA